MEAIGYPYGADIGYVCPPVTPIPNFHPHVLGELVDEARLGPGRIDGSSDALDDGTSSVTWSEYVDRVARLAGVLVGIDVAPGDRVGIRLSKSVESFIAVHAVLRAGAVVVPVDPLAPPGHGAAVLTDAGATVLIADGRARILDDLIAASPIGSLILPSTDRSKAPNPSDDLDVIVGADIDATPPAELVDLAVDDPAYIIYTSGSTGRPKGIVHSHRSALAYATRAARAYELLATDRLANIAPLHFDQSTFELYAAPLVGATVVVVPEPVLRFPASVSQLIDDQRITVWYSVPYLLGQLSDRGVLDERDLSSLRWVLFGGESFPPGELARLMRQMPGARFSNVYGPAEVNQCMLFNLSGPPDGDEPVPIGRAWSGAELRLAPPDDLDDRSGPPSGKPVGEVSRGEPGVLLVRSDTMMSGYWNRPDLTAGSMIVDPSSDGGSPPWYITGDLVTERTDGNLVFLGRRDNQIKLRGHRIELEALDAVLRDLEGVAEATVVVERSDTSEDRLVGIVVLDPTAIDPDAAVLDAVATQMRRQVPRYAVPDDLISVPSLPRTSSGKVDRGASSALLDVPHDGDPRRDWA